MKKYLFLFLLLGLNNLSLLGQECFPVGQNDTGIKISSITLDTESFMSEDNNYVTIFNDTILIINNLLSFSGNTTQDMQAGIDSVFWRVSIDINEDGFINGEEVVYESGKVATGEIGALLDFTGLNLNEDSPKDLKIEMASNPDLFGVCNGTTIPDNAAYNLFILKAIGVGKLCASNENPNGTLDDKCPQCLPNNGTLKFYIRQQVQTGGGGTPTCNINIDTIELKSEVGNLTVPLTITSAQAEINNQSGQGISFPFDLQTGQEALVTITYNPNSIISLGDTGEVKIVLSYEDGCNPNGTISSDSTGFGIYFGCYDEVNVLYDNHSRVTNIPEYTGADESIIGQTNAVFNNGTESVLKVAPDGMIHMKSGTQVESGSYFWAYKGDTCLLSNLVAIGGLTSNNEIELVLNDFNIFPNPLLDYSTIQYQLQKKAEVSISLYDVLGKKVKTLLPFQSELPGTYQHEIDLSAIPAGLYYVNFQLDNSFLSKPIIKHN